MKLTLEPACVYKWKDFSHQRYGTLKTRWLICLGNTSHFEQVQGFHFLTTTTNFDVFKSGGARNGHLTKQFFASNGIFEQDCLLDFHEQPYMITTQQLQKDEEHIEFKGKLGANDMQSIYNGLKKAGYTPAVVLRDIKENLQSAGIAISKR